MKTALILSVLFTGFLAFGATPATPPAPAIQAYSFQFKAANSSKTFAITQNAASRDEAYKLAARECFNKLTGGQYPGEDKGLEIIDICANPKM